MSVESGDERGGGWSKCRDGPVVAAPPGWDNPCPEEVAGQMESPHARRILIVANRTAAKPRRPAEVGARAARGPCRFTLLGPRPFWDPDTEEAAITLELALPLLDEAAEDKWTGSSATRTRSSRYATPASAARVRRGDRLDAADARVALATARPARAREATRAAWSRPNGWAASSPPRPRSKRSRVRRMRAL